MDSSTTLWLLIGFSALQVGGGFLVGWWLRSSRKGGSRAAEILSKRLNEALVRLQNIAGDISHDATRHAQEVRAVNLKLGAAETDDVESFHQALVEGMAQIISANDRLQSHLNDVEARLEEQSRAIDAQLAEARLDGLTGVHNRRAFDEEIGRRMAEWRRRQTPLSLMMVDVDHFKSINDRFGHQTGDLVLREIARSLQTTTREMDFTARYGGEEFAVILPSTGLRDARRAARRVLEAVAGRRFEVDDGEIDVTVSVGLAEVNPGDDTASLIRRADEALYLSKAAGRNCGHFHSGADCIALDSPRLCESLLTAPPVVDEAVDAGEAGTPRRRRASDLADEVDPLTGLPTAGVFSEELRRQMQRVRTEGMRLSLVLTDVDRLVKLNEEIGRDAGDLVLRRTANVLRQYSRPLDYLARYHQGQFALLMYGVGLAEAAQTAEKIRIAVQEAGAAGNDPLAQATVSCGVADGKLGDRAVSLVMRAGVALSAAKSAGRDCTFVHDGQTPEPAETLTLRS